MENNKPKCSSIEHKEIDAVIFCQNCKVYFCNKCENFHSKIFQGHLITNLANEKNKDIFTGLCQENNHMNVLEYYCKSHNKLCCGLCISKIKDEKNGHHKDCLITSLKEIKSEKEEKFKNDYNKLQEISKSIESLITQLKNIKIDINKKKEQIMNEIQKIFTKLRTVLNNREDELLKEVEEAYKKNCFDDNIIKESEKISGKTKKCLDSVNDLNIIKEKNKELNFEINFYIQFEKNLNEIDELIQIINKLNSKTYELNLEVNNDKLESDIKKFGKINQIIKEIEIRKIKFEQKNIEKIIEMKDAKFININNIKIKNVGNISAHKLFFIKNKEKSSNDFCFFGNSKANDEYELSMPGELKPNESLNCNISMNIINPQPEKEYKAIIYAKENNEIISEPFEIIIKTKEDSMKQKQIQANQIFEEIKNKFAAHKDLTNKKNIINKLIQNNLNKDEIINEIKNAIKEKKQKEINSKAERLYNELNLNNINIDKNEIISIIKEKKFDKEEIQKWLDEKAKIQNKEKAQNLYNNLRNGQNLDFSKCPNVEAILNKIIELKFNENDLRNFFKAARNEEEDPKVMEIFNELEDEYNLTGLKEKEEIIEKIIELKCDRDKINEWVEGIIYGDI